MRLHRPGFSLFQLLLLLALLGIAFAVFLPAIIRARAEALKQQKLMNLQQIGLALHNYHDANGFLPAGNDKANYSASAYLLPYLEQDNVYKMLFQNIQNGVPCDADANAKVAAMPLKVFLSPNDPRMGVKEGLGATNYLFNAGSKHSLVTNDGLFYQESKHRLTDCTDGTSNTIFAGETLKGDGETKAVDVKRQHVLLDKDALKDIKDETGVAEWKDGKKVVGDRCAAWIDGRFLKGTFAATRKLNDERPDVSCAGFGGLSALRSLDGSVGVGMADGSVRVVKDTIAFETWQALCTRAGGEVIPDF
jgi:type II secretory pathway pseudopilin PulG